MSKKFYFILLNVYTKGNCPSRLITCCAGRKCCPADVSRPTAGPKCERPKMPLAAYIALPDGGVMCWRRWRREILAKEVVEVGQKEEEEEEEEDDDRVKAKTSSTSTDWRWFTSSLSKKHSLFINIKKNWSPFYLHQCLAGLVQQQANRAAFTNFRSCMLTKVFQPYLTGTGGRTNVIYNLNPLKLRDDFFSIGSHSRTAEGHPSVIKQNLLTCSSVYCCIRKKGLGRLDDSGRIIAWNCCSFSSYRIKAIPTFSGSGAWLWSRW